MFRKLFFATLLATNSAVLIAKDYGPQPDTKTQSKILALREQAWRAWFSNDVKGFEATVPEELVGIGWSDGPWQDRKSTIEDMQEFAKSGQYIARLEFVHNVFQQYENVIVLYSKFEIDLKQTDGVVNPVKGRCSEIFVKRKGKWIHTGWHLDNISK